jgi:hypothetical protein
MQISRSKIMATMIALLLMLTITATLATVPIANAHTPAWTIPTNAYIIATPNPVGVGEYTTLVCWVDQNPPIAGGQQGPRWAGYKIDITKPDGSKQTIGPWTERSATASDWQTFVPDQVGTYTLVFSWPGQTLTNESGIYQTGGIPYIGDYFAGSTSAPLSLVVTQEPTPQWQEPPLPTEFWTTPINDANRGWSTLASNWLGGSWLKNNFQQWGTAPESPHVLWTKPMTPGIAGGINDAQWPGIPTDADDYESPWRSPIIMNGKIYYNQPSIGIESGSPWGYYCIDLYTGEQVWYKNGTDNGLNAPYNVATGLGSRTAWGSKQYAQLSMGWLYHYDSANGQGILAYLIMQQTVATMGVMGSTWYLLDAYTGNWICSIVNVPSGTAVTDQDGSLLLYSYNSATGNLLCWNISQCITPSAPFGTGQQQWKLRYGGTYDAVNDTTWTKMGVLPGMASEYDTSDILPHSGYTMNLTIQKGLPGSISVIQDANRVPKYIFGTPVLSGLGALGTAISPDTFEAWMMRIDEHVNPYSPFPDKTNTQNNNLGFGVTMLWDKNFTVPLPGHNYTWSCSAPDSSDNPVFILDCKQTMQHWGYDAMTGNLLWGPTASEGTFNYYGMGSNAYYGKILSCGLSGTLYAYDKLTGDLLWTYNATSVGRESPYGENYPLSIGAVCDGKVYLYSTEHSPTKPLWRGSYIRCVNITDGTELWKLLYYRGFGGSPELADGYIVGASTYDNLIYCIGKGPSAVTVDAPLTAITVGSSAVIQGTVTDISPGTKQLVQASNFPNGVPAVADADMEAWMEYLYEQQAMPTSAKGVEVTLDAIDPNNNFIHIGTATSDTSGLFSYAWATPDVPGKYTIIATFAGSNSYYASYTETACFVSEAPPATQPPQYPIPADYTLTIIGTGIAIIIAVAIAVILLRKRP